MAVNSASAHEQLSARQLAEQAWEVRRTNPQESRALGEQALALALQGNDAVALARSYHVVGIAYHQTARSSDAIVHLKKAHALYEELHDTANTASVLRIMGGILTDLGNYAEALATLLQAVALAKNTNNADELIGSLLNLAVVHGALNDAHKALDIYAEAESVALQYNHYHALSIIYRNMGINHSRLDNNDQAIAFLRKALALQHRLGNRPMLAVMLDAIAAVYTRQHNNAKALRYYAAALRIRGQMEVEPLALAVSFANIGEVLETLGNYAEALRYTQQGIALAERIQAKDMLCTMYKFCADICEKLGDIPQAYTYLQQSYALQRELADKEQQKAIAMYKTQAETEGNKRKQEELQRRLREAEHTALRSQMNPHFISNALNAIQSFVIEGNAIEAQRYLSLFARLVRHSFEQTRSSLISLDEELTTLRLYLDIEKLRFEHGFDFSIAVEPPIQPAQLYVPPMLLQPFVENAIMHGILPSRTAGTVCVTVALSSQHSLLCSIEDNGVGIELSKQYAHTRHTKYGRSLGITLIRERLALLQEATNQPATLHVENLYNDKGTPAGTRVELHLPILHSPKAFSL